MPGLYKAETTPGTDPHTSDVKAIRLRGACDLAWPSKIVSKLVEQAVAANPHVAVCPHTPVTAVVPIDGGHRRFRVDYVRGHGDVVTTSIQCDNVVYATNAYTPTLVPELKGKIVPVKNHVVATPAGMPPLMGDGSCVGFSLHPGFHYFSQRRDGRIILGECAGGAPQGLCKQLCSCKFVEVICHTAKP